jgi:hypothetical protein
LNTTLLLFPIAGGKFRAPEECTPTTNARHDRVGGNGAERLSIMPSAITRRQTSLQSATRQQRSRNATCKCHGPGRMWSAHHARNRPIQTRSHFLLVGCVSISAPGPHNISRTIGFDAPAAAISV